jgi:hypothetical protein
MKPGWLNGGRNGTEGPEGATISASDGSQVQVSFTDSPQTQYIDFNRPDANYIEASWLKIQVDAIYPGTEWDDACVSEVEIWGQ